MVNLADRKVPGTTIAAGFIASWALLLALIYSLGSEDGTPNAGLAAVAFGAPFLSIAIAVLAAEVRRTPWIVAACGIALFLMSLAIFNPIGFPLLIAAGFLVAQSFADRKSWPRTASITAVVLGAVACGAVIALVVHEDPAKWQTSNGGSSSSSDIVTRTEARISLALSALVVVVSAASPPRGMRAPGRTPAATGS